MCLAKNILLISLLAGVFLASGSADDGGDSDKKDNDQMWPFLLMVAGNGATTVHSPGLWVMGLLAAGAMVVLQGIKYKE